MNSRIYEEKDIFFDPWIAPGYYYNILPALPLIFHRVFVYYPSDRWLAEENHLGSTVIDWYRNELAHWIQEGVIVPIVQGNYPFENDIPRIRSEKDGPTSSFREALKYARSHHGESWVILEKGVTERGRESARNIINELGDSAALMQELHFEAKPGAIPELAYYYGVSNKDTKEKTLVETIGTYENDDWMRRELGLGEYLLPSVMAYQYRALQDLRQHSDDGDIRHNMVRASTVDQHLRQRHLRQGIDWIEREKIEQWRALGLHNVLREFLTSEAASIDTDTETAIEPLNETSLNERLATIRSSLPIEMASAIIDKKLVASVLLTSGILGGFVTSGPAGAVAGAMAGVLVGKVGRHIVRLSLKGFRWDRFLDLLASTLGWQTSLHIERYVLAFGDVTILGNR